MSPYSVSLWWKTNPPTPQQEQYTTTKRGGKDKIEKQKNIPKPKKNLESTLQINKNKTKNNTPTTGTARC